MQLEPEAGPVAEQRLDLVGEMAGDDVDAREAGGGELPEQRRDDRSAVDREDRLRPAVGQRAQAGALARGHHDRVH